MKFTRRSLKSVPLGNHKGNPIPTFSWTKNGKPIESSRCNFFSDGELIGLEIVDANVGDSGSYECHLSNDEGSCVGVCNAEVKKVYSAPFFSKPLNSIQQLRDCDAKFVCEVNSNPRPEVSWFFNGQQIHSSGTSQDNTVGCVTIIACQWSLAGTKRGLFPETNYHSLR